jgi:hypothetical protein
VSNVPARSPLAVSLLLAIACGGDPTDDPTTDTGEVATVEVGDDPVVPLGSVRPSFGGPLHIMDLAPAGTGVVAASYAGLFGVSLADPASPVPDGSAYGSDLYWTDASDTLAWSGGRNTGIGRVSHDGAGVLSSASGRPQTGLEGIVAAGGVLYAAAQTQGLVWLDASSMNLLGSDAEPTNAIDVAITGSTLWVADRERGLLSYGLDASGSPGFIGELGLDGSAQAIDAVDGVVAIASGGEVHLIDGQDPNSPSLVSTIRITGVATRVSLRDAATLAVAAWNDTRIYDISDLSSPALLAVEDATSSAMSVAWVGENLVVGDWDDLRTYAVDLDARGAEWTARSWAAVTAPAGEALSYNMLVHNEGTLDLGVTAGSCAGAEVSITPEALTLGPDERGTFILSGTSATSDPYTVTCTFETTDPDETETSPPTSASPTSKRPRSTPSRMRVGRSCCSPSSRACDPRVAGSCLASKTTSGSRTRTVVSSRGASRVR